MRAVLAILFLILVGGAALWSLRDDGAATPRPPAPSERPAERANDDAAAAPVHADRLAATPSAPDATASTDAGGSAATQTPSAAPPEQLTPRLRLAVYDLATRLPIDRFRWRFTAGKEQVHGEVDGSTTALSLLDFDRGDLLVEADGMQPHIERDLALPNAGSPALALPIYLTPVPTAAGIELLVSDADGAPVPHVRVDAFALDATVRDTAWHLGKPLWARQASADDGHYRLPDLPVGEFGIRLIATFPDGLPRPLSSYRGSFQLTGSNGFVEHVALEPACALRLELLAPNGQPFDPEPFGNVTITLNRTGEVGTQRKWSAQVGERWLSELDHVPAQGVIWPADPVPPGNYVLKVFIDGDPRVRQTLVLLPQVQTERVTVL